MKNVVLLGKGKVAVLASAWFKEHWKKYNLKLIVPSMPEPTWTDSITEWADEAEVPVLKSGKYQDIPSDMGIDLAVSIFYDKIIKKNFIDRCGDIINLHNSPLPFYRGVRPINWAMKNGENHHGVTIHRIAPGIDDGPIYGQLTYPIYPEVESIKDVYDKSVDYGWSLFKDVMSKFEHLQPYPQESDGSYYSSKDVHDLGEWGDWSKK